MAERIPSVYALTERTFASVFPEVDGYRFRQLASWRKTGALSFSEYRNMGKDAIAILSERCNVFSSAVGDDSECAESGKMLLVLEDGLKVECVAINNGDSVTFCLSSQVGCALGCAFCATATLGFGRNLRSYEIVEQFYHLKRVYGSPEGIVFMGMGEPLLNLSAVAEAVRFITREEGISARKVTISTSGVADKIPELASLGLGTKLAVSLVAADGNLRRRLMPIAGRFGLDVLKDALLSYQKADGRRITLAYCMMKGVNMSLSAAQALLRFSRGLIVHVNLIPWNRIESLPFDAPSVRDVVAFKRTLESLGLSCSVRHSKGHEISSACGELALKVSRRDSADGKDA